MKRALLFLVPIAVVLSGCAVAPASPSYGYSYGYGYDDAPYGGPVWVQGAVPYYEAVPASPYVGGIWIGGSWSDDHGRREWRPGHWAPPRGGHEHARPPYRRDVRDPGDHRVYRPPVSRPGVDDDRRGRGRGDGGWANDRPRGERRPALRQTPSYPGAAFDAGSRTDPRITPP